MLTAGGEIKFSRVYFKCVKCCNGGYTADERVGIDGRYSIGTQQLMTLAAGSWGCEISSQRLEEFCGLKACANTIREIAQRHGAAMNRWQQEASEAANEFRQSAGDIEFSTDGTSVNTTLGWREMKLGMFSKRPAGDAATPDEWSTRILPKPTSQVAFAAIERSGRFGSRWKHWTRRLGIRDTSTVTVLADGAKWIWEEQRKHLIGASGVLDVFHVLEKIAQTSNVVHEDDATRTSEWLDEGRERLLRDGWQGIEQHVMATLRRARSKKKRASLNALLDYLESHISHINYADRLTKGQSIGSGQIEGACKNMIGRRLKQTGARWKVRRVNRMAGVCCTMYSNNWNKYWDSVAA